MKDISSSKCIGYPVNLDLDMSYFKELSQFPFYNVGVIPFDSNQIIDNHAALGIDTRVHESKVLNFIAGLYHIPDDEWFGYIGSGSTEANIFGLYLARELYPDGILYCSDKSHYSIFKASKILKLELCCIPSHVTGEINIGVLEKEIKKNLDRPVILNLNIGTTMSGAIDKIEPIVTMLENYDVQNHYIHCDAALFGMMLPFIDNSPLPTFKNPIDSLVISGHKFIGSPMPCGLILTKKQYVDKISKPVEYAKTPDVTIAGIRNGHTALIMWHAIQSRGKQGFARETKLCIENARFLYDNLININYPTKINDYSNIVLLKKPSQAIVDKWDLATEGEWAHVVVMQHVNRKSLTEFIHDISVQQ